MDRPAGRRGRRAHDGPLLRGRRAPGRPGRPGSPVPHGGGAGAKRGRRNTATARAARPPDLPARAASAIDACCGATSTTSRAPPWSGISTLSASTSTCGAARAMSTRSSSRHGGRGTPRPGPPVRGPGRPDRPRGAQRRQARGAAPAGGLVRGLGHVRHDRSRDDPRPQAHLRSRTRPLCGRPASGGSLRDRVPRRLSGRLRAGGVARTHRLRHHERVGRQALQDPRGRRAEAARPHRHGARTRPRARLHEADLRGRSCRRRTSSRRRP